MSNSEARWFKIISFVVTGIIAGVLLADIIYFNELRVGTKLSEGEITSMLVITGILFAIVIVMFIWSLIRLFSHKDTKVKQTTQIKSVISPSQPSTDSVIGKSYTTRMTTPSQEPAVTETQKRLATD